MLCCMSGDVLLMRRRDVSMYIHEWQHSDVHEKESPVSGGFVLGR